MQDSRVTAVTGRTVFFADLFSGIGAMRLGFQQACVDLGVEPKCVGFSEIDAHATSTYLRHFPGTPALGDITTLAASGNSPKCDVLLAGFPCQDASSAGKRLGLAGPRGKLFFALADVIAAACPSAFLLENVKGLASLDGGKAFKIILETLTRLGYTVRHVILNSCDFGVPQNRPRIYFVGFRQGGEGFAFPLPTDSTKRLKDILVEKPVAAHFYLTERSLERIRQHKTRHKEKGNGFGAKFLDAEVDVTGTLKSSNWGREDNFVVDRRIELLPIPSSGKDHLNSEFWRKLTPIEWERLQGIPDDFTAGQVDGHRYRQLGNAVTIPVVKSISLNLLTSFKGKCPEARPVVEATHGSDETAASTKLINVLDLFSGCGGLSTGFLQTGGFRIVAACDLNHAAAATYESNHPGTLMVPKDITAEGTRQEICAAFAGVRCDVVMGGVPCQAYTKSKHRDPNDPRGKLYEPFIDVVSRLMPSAAVIENVPDIMTMRHADGTLVAHRIATLLSSLGYIVGQWVLNSADFGCPQRRFRAFIFAWRDCSIPRPVNTHDESGKNGLPRWLTVRDAIGDLEDASEDEGWSHIFSHHGAEMSERIHNTPIGGSAAISYNEGYYRNTPDLPCRTLRGGSWPIHYRHHRVITVREGARIQGFPDGFRFEGSKAEQMLMVGNAVPPPLAKAVGLAVLRMLGVEPPSIAAVPQATL
ncbi:MAG: DNA (cytosine-5-)-methyltransferase [Kiritimatiellia bacterium]